MKRYSVNTTNTKPMGLCQGIFKNNKNQRNKYIRSIPFLWEIIWPKKKSRINKTLCLKITLKRIGICFVENKRYYNGVIIPIHTIGCKIGIKP